MKPSSAPKPTKAPERRNKTRPKRLRRILILTAFVVLMVGAYFGGRYALSEFAQQRASDEEGMVIITWPPGTDADEAGKLLGAVGLVDSPRAMAAYLRLTGEHESVAPGRHLLPRRASPVEIMELLRREDDRPRAKLVIPEGFHRFRIAARLERLGICPEHDFLAVTEDPIQLENLALEGPDGTSPESAEGYLFPATYELPYNAEPLAVLERLVGESQRRWDALAARYPEGLLHLEEELGWGRREIVILASVVEKEAAVDDERPVIASVFLNRMTDPEFRPRRLQSDPTAGYGCVAYPEEAPSCAGYEGRITPAINRDPLNRYSSYRHDGLPPGPIANPGERSLEAVLAPEETDYFFFVAIGQGRHRFSQTYEEHKAAIRGDDP